MTNIINFPTPKGNNEIPEEWIIHYDGDPSLYTPCESALHIKAMEMAKELDEVVGMTLWQRIFNWPY